MAILAVIPTTDLRWKDLRDTLVAHGGNVSNMLQTAFTDGTIEFRRKPHEGETPQSDGYVHWFPDAKINKWSLNKPYVYNDEDECPRDVQDGIINLVKCGLTARALWSSGVGPTFREWDYDLPRGTNTSPLRLGDFRGYNPSAQPPFTKTAEYFDWNTSQSAQCPIIQFLYNQSDIRMGWVNYEGQGDYLYVAIAPYVNGDFFINVASWVSEDMSFVRQGGQGTINLNSVSAAWSWMRLEDRKYTWAFYVYRGALPTKTTNAYGETLDTSNASLLNMPIGLTTIDIYKFWLSGLGFDVAQETLGVTFITSKTYDSGVYTETQATMASGTTAASTFNTLSQTNTGFLVITFTALFTNDGTATKVIDGRTITAQEQGTASIAIQDTELDVWMEDNNGDMVEGTLTTFTWPTAYAWSSTTGDILYSFVLPRLNDQGGVDTDTTRRWPVCVYEYQNGVFDFETNLVPPSGGINFTTPTRFIYNGATYDRSQDDDLYYTDYNVAELDTAQFFPQRIGFLQDDILDVVEVPYGETESTGISLVWQGRERPIKWNANTKLRMELRQSGHVVPIIEGTFRLV